MICMIKLCLLNGEASWYARGIIIILCCKLDYWEAVENTSTIILTYDSISISYANIFQHQVINILLYMYIYHELLWWNYNNILCSQGMERALATLVVMECAYPLTMSVITTWTAAMLATKPTALQPPSRIPTTLGSCLQGAPTPQVSLVCTHTHVHVRVHR